MAKAQPLAALPPRKRSGTRSVAMFWRSNQFWRLATLADFWRALQWMEAQRAASRGDQAFERFAIAMTANIVEGIPRYRDAVHRVNALAGGIMADPTATAASGLKLPDGVTMIDRLNDLSAKLHLEYQKLDAIRPDAKAAHWAQVGDNTSAYIRALSTLVQDFGNFEPLIMSLPGVGPVPVHPQVQENLITMYQINTRNIRMFEMLQALRKSWTKNQPCDAFFASQTDLGNLLQRMLGEYMIESDPVRINAARERAKATGRAHQRYRFWRPAETFRQLAAVHYSDDKKRKPRPTRRFVQLNVQPSPPVCADATRLEWSIKEIFNNAIAATSFTRVDGGNMQCMPLQKHRDGKQYAIELSVEPVEIKRWFRTEKWVRVSIVDHGIGMVETLARNAPLWAYSSRRAGVDNRLEPIKPDHPSANDLIIGGKGIGLAFATASVRELGGTITIQSTVDRGTRVEILLPSPTPFTR